MDFRYVLRGPKLETEAITVSTYRRHSLPYLRRIFYDNYILNDEQRRPSSICDGNLLRHVVHRHSYSGLDESENSHCLGTGMSDASY